MNITTTAIAVTLALVVAGGFLFYGQRFLAPQTAATTASTTAITQSVTEPMTDPTNQQPQATGASANLSGPAATQPLPTTLTVTDEVVGTGAEAKAGDTVEMNYVGTLPNGTVFDASAKHGQSFTFKLGAGQVIAGWDQGIVGMKEGGKRKLIIPPSMGYGDRDLGAIPPNSTLIFEVELVKVSQ